MNLCLLLQFSDQTSTVNPTIDDQLGVNNQTGSQNRQSDRTLEIAEMSNAEWDQFIAGERGKSSFGTMKDI